MKHASLILSLGAIAALGFAAHANATVALSGEVNVAANTSIGSTTNGNTNFANWTGAPSAIAAATSSAVFSGNDSVFAHSNAAATWASADSGTITLSNYGWTFNVASSPSAADLFVGRPGDGDWAYTFTATSNGVFTLNYDITGSGFTFGLWGFPFAGIAGTGGPVVNAVDPTQSGTFTGALVNGTTYMAFLSGFANVENNGGANYTGSMDGNFNWSITNTAGAPEPAAWALILLGFGGLGGALRRRRPLIA